MKKKFLGIVLVIAMLCALLPVSVFAEETDPIPAPANLRWNGQVAEWDPVEGATAYNILLYRDNNYTYLDGPGAKPDWVNNTDTSYDMTALMQANGSGSYTFTVRAKVGTGFVYTETSPKSAVYTYSEPNVVHLSWDGFKAKWNKADSATKYCLSLYKDGTKIVDQQDVGTAVQLDLSPVIVGSGLGNYTFSITTYKGSETTESAMSLAKEYTTVCYKVTFSDEVGTTPPQYVEEGGKAVLNPNVPIKTGYIFDSWCSDSACTTKYNFDTPVTGELTLYAKYTQHPIAANLKWNGYTAQWDAVDGAVNYIVYLYKNGVACAVNGDQVPGDTASTAASYDMSSYINQFGPGMYTFTVTTEFYGWYMESLESAHSPELFAPKDFTVTFNANGGSGTAAPVAVKEKDNYTLPANPFKAPIGKKFKCWNVDGTEMAPGGTVNISGNITVKAVWEDLPHTHSWDGGKVKTEATALAAGEKVYTCTGCNATKSETIPKIKATGWQQIKGTWYYFNSDGTLAKNEWVDGYWINADGSWTYQLRGSWHLNSTGWWYGDTSGWYAANGIQKIDGVAYKFDASGYLYKGWQQEGGAWYYYNEGVKATGWVNDGGTWYYMNLSGVMQTGWVKDGSSWYYLNPSGAMATGWVNAGGTWYYMNSSGAMATGWVNDGGTWYYMKASGAMAENEWCDGYWLNAGGSWTYQPRASWKQDSTGWWYGDTSGWFAANCTQKIDDVVYKFNAQGYWVK